jgi:hypothetical protein
MKTLSLLTIILMSGSQLATAQNKTEAATPQRQLFMDVHHMEPGKVKFADVEAAHRKDLAAQGKYDVNFLKYWVDEEQGLIYCLSSAPGSEAVKNTHAEAHGLMPSEIYAVTDGEAAAFSGNNNLYLDVHYLGAGKVTANDVVEAHKKDLAVQKEHGVNFINYWVDENAGVVMCLSQAPDANAVVSTHKHAHGLIPATVLTVKEGK